MSHIFISYSSKDKEFVDGLKSDLELHGFSTWIDRDKLESGDVWYKVLTDAIKNASALIVVMTPEAQNSDWVLKEILLAYKFQVEIFPLLLRGELFEILIEKHYTLLTKERNYLPPIRFYQNLKNRVHRAPQDLEKLRAKSEWANKPLPKSTAAQINTFTKNYLINLSDWTDYARPSANNYHGIAMLALAFEELGEHKNAIYFLKKSHQLEPRIKDKAWMTYYHGWSESHHKLLESIITDSDFWLPIKP